MRVKFFESSSVMASDDGKEDSVFNTNYRGLMMTRDIYKK
jgi:hypothetical protein